MTKDKKLTASGIEIRAFLLSEGGRMDAIAGLSRSVAFNELNDYDIRIDLVY